MFGYKSGRLAAERRNEQVAICLMGTHIKVLMNEEHPPHTGNTPGGGLPSRAGTLTRGFLRYLASVCEVMSLL